MPSLWGAMNRIHLLQGPGHPRFRSDAPSCTASDRRQASQECLEPVPTATAGVTDAGLTGVHHMPIKCTGEIAWHLHVARGLNRCVAKLPIACSSSGHV